MMKNIGNCVNCEFYYGIVSCPTINGYCEKRNEITIFYDSCDNFKLKNSNYLMDILSQSLLKLDENKEKTLYCCDIYKEEVL